MTLIILVQGACKKVDSLILVSKLFCRTGMGLTALEALRCIERGAGVGKVSFFLRRGVEEERGRAVEQLESLDLPES